MTDQGTALQRSSGREEVDDRVAATVDRMISEGTPRLHRTTLDLLLTATLAGVEVAVGVAALLVVEVETGSQLLGGIAFGFGFLALLLGHSELFTEGFLVPVTVVVAKAARVRDLFRFWVGSALGNLVGGWAMTWVVVQSFPSVRHKAVESATTFVDGGETVHSLCLAILAGTAITMMTRMHQGTESIGVRAMVSVFAAFVLSGLGLAHSILESLLIFTALHTGAAPFGYGDWLGWFGWTVLGNVIGGVGLVTLLRLVRSRELFDAHREERS